MAEIYQIPDGNTGNNASGIPLSIPIGNGGGLFCNGQTNLMDILGIGIIAAMFPGILGNRFGGFGGGAGGAGFISNQLNNDSGRELIMNAINAQGEAQRTAVQTLAATIGQDFNLVNGAILNLQNSLNGIANAQGMSTLQVINAIQSGNASIISQFQNCCCQNQLATERQTATLQGSIAGVNQNLAAKTAADQLALCQQTYNLTQNDNANARAILAKLDAIEDSRKDREIAALTARNAQLENQNFSTALVQQAINPVLSQLSGIRAEVDSIKRCQPPTITIPNNSMTAVPTIWANAVADNIVDKISAALNGGTTTTTTGGGTGA